MGWAIIGPHGMRRAWGSIGEKWGCLGGRGGVGWVERNGMAKAYSHGTLSLSHGTLLWSFRSATSDWALALRDLS